MADDQLGLEITKEWLHFGEELPRNVFRGRWHIGKRWMILVEEFVVEALVAGLSPRDL